MLLQIFCGDCSKYEAQLQYKKYKAERVCRECYKELSLRSKLCPVSVVNVIIAIQRCAYQQALVCAFNLCVSHKQCLMSTLCSYRNV